MTKPAALVLVLVALAAPAFPQEPPPPIGPLPIGPGARVRLTQVGGGRLQGFLAGSAPGSLTLALPSDNPLAPVQRLEVPLASLTRVELSTGKRNFAWVGALIGAVVIGATGFSDPVDESPGCGSYYYSTEPCSRGEAVAIAVVAGALVGGAVGFFIKQERWTPVAIEALGAPPPAGEAPRPAAVTAGITLRF